MARVKVTVVGRAYDLACDDGEESKVAELAAMVDRRASELMASVGSIDERRLFLMVGILLANDLQAAEGQGRASGSKAAKMSTKEHGAAAECLVGAAGQLESLAARIEDA